MEGNPLAAVRGPRPRDDRLDRPRDDRRRRRVRRDAGCRQRRGRGQVLRLDRGGDRPGAGRRRRALQAGLRRAGLRQLGRQNHPQPQPRGRPVRRERRKNFGARPRRAAESPRRPRAAGLGRQGAGRLERAGDRGAGQRRRGVRGAGLAGGGGPGVRFRDRNDAGIGAAGALLARGQGAPRRHARRPCRDGARRARAPRGDRRGALPRRRARLDRCPGRPLPGRGRRLFPDRRRRRGADRARQVGRRQRPPIRQRHDRRRAGPALPSYRRGRLPGRGPKR